MVAKAKELDTSKSSGAAVQNFKSVKPSKSDDLRLHYIIIDGLTSSWREFLALHELSTKIKLSYDILATTPEKDKGNYIPNIPTPTGYDESFSSTNDW